MTTPDPDGWVPWTEDDAGYLHPPDLGELEDGETIESRYDYDQVRLNRAGSRKVIASESDGYGFPCKGCRAMIMVVPGSPPLVPYQASVKRISCPKCGETHGYSGQMVRIH